MKVLPVLHFASTMTMKVFLALVLLSALGLLVSFFHHHTSKIVEAFILFPL
jgi:hypothetical protein